MGGKYAACRLLRTDHARARLQGRVRCAIRRPGDEKAAQSLRNLRGQRMDQERYLRCAGTSVHEPWAISA
ncbi:hypothetical protein, partial [Ottowia sp.]|uniref:hypothetical protein n=1 Tax=Ottowia sp. TaxID=1898956 RepID=UPI0025E6FDCD